MITNVNKQDQDKIRSNILKKIKLKISRSKVPKVNSLRKYELFSDILKDIETAMKNNSQSAQMLAKFLELIDDLKNKSKHLSYSQIVDFIENNLNSLIDNIPNQDISIKLFKELLVKSKKNLEKISNFIQKEIKDREKYFIFFWSFLLYAIQEILDNYNPSTFKSICEHFELYIILPFSYVYRKPHTIILFNKTKKEVPKFIEILEGLYKNPNILYKNVQRLRKYLEDNNFPYDVERYPQIFKRFLFGNEYNAISFNIYPVTSIRYIPNVKESEGLEWESIRLPKRIYMEVLFNRNDLIFLVSLPIKYFKIKNEVITRIINAIDESINILLCLGNDTNTRCFKNIFSKNFSKAILQKELATILEFDPNKLVGVVEKIIEKTKMSKRDSISSFLDKIEEEINKRVLSEDLWNKVILSHTNKIKEFIKNMTLLGINWKIVYRKRFVINNSLIVTLPEYNKEVDTLLKRNIETFKFMLSKYKKDLEITYVLGNKKDYTQSIEITKRGNEITDVRFNGLPRDAITELIYILSLIFQR